MFNGIKCYTFSERACCLECNYTSFVSLTLIVWAQFGIYYFFSKWPHSWLVVHRTLNLTSWGSIWWKLSNDIWHNIPYSYFHQTRSENMKFLISNWKKIFCNYIFKYTIKCYISLESICWVLHNDIFYLVQSCTDLELFQFKDLKNFNF